MARIRFEITDTGLGIAPEDLGKIFEPFQQTGAQHYRQQGTGLGLAITRNLIRLMGGDLQVTSTLGAGSTFWFDLLLPVVAAASTDAPKAAQRIIGIAGAAPRIVVVDDDPVNCGLVTDMLAPLGFDVREAAGGQDAWQICLAWPPQALIADLRMPALDGLALIRQLRQTPAFTDLVIIASSASAYAEDQQQSVAAGAQAFLPKPLAVNDLLACLQRFLRLTWRYADAAPSAEASAAAEVILPPASTLETLHAFAKIGDITELRKTLAELAQEPRFIPFAARLQELARQFEMDDIRKLLEDYVAQAKEE